MELTKESFGKVENQEVYLFTLKNKKGLEIRITNYGGIITHLFTPDKKGNFGDIVLGFDSIEGYLKDSPYFGALIGRHSNRIAKGRFILDGKEYKLAINNGPNHLHGGIKGFDKVIWQPEEIRNPNSVGVRLKYFSKDMEEGYPGNLEVMVTYLLNNEGDLEIKYLATTDKKTIINLTNHSYFNLAAGEAKNIYEHELLIHANRYTPIDDFSIPTGELKELKGSEMDFTEPRKIGARLQEVKGGYDHNYVLNDFNGKTRLVARVHEPTSGRVLEVFTDQPGVQFYSGNFLDGTLIGKNNTQYVKHYGFCLETQHFPDTPNHPNFPTTVLNPDDKFESTTIYSFRVR